MRKILVLAAMLAAVMVGQADAGLVANYDFTGAAGDEASWAVTSNAALVSATALTRGSGITPSQAAGAFSASDWSVGSLDSTAFFSFSVTSDANSLMTLSSLSFAERRSGTGIRNFELRTSLDGFSTFLSQTVTSVPDNTSTRQQTITLSELTGLVGGTTVEFRLYGYNAEGSGGTWRLSNHSTFGGLYLDGSVSAVPEPSALLLVGSVLGLGALRRRRS